MSNDLLYEEREHRGFICKVFYDDCPQSPAEWDNLGHLYSNHREYNPDKHRIEELLVEDENGNMHIDTDYIYVKVYAYIHSGIALSCSRAGQFSDPWDSGLFGVIAVKRSKAEAEFGDLSDIGNYNRVIRCLESEVSEWDDYFQGNVFGYQVIDKNGECIESCWGFYGNPDDVMEEALVSAECMANKVEKAEMICEPFWID